MSNIAIKGNTSGTGTFTLEAPDSNDDRTLILPDEAGTVLTSASTLSSSNLSGALPALDGSALTGVSAGKVLKVVTTLKQNTFSGTADLGSFEDITGLNASITPSSTSSKILVMVTAYLSPSPSNYTVGTRLKRFIAGDAFTYLGDTRSGSTRMSGFGNSGSGGANFMGFMFLDSPSTTSTTTYTLQAGSESGSNYVVGGSYDSGSAYHGSVPSTIILMEIDPS